MSRLRHLPALCVAALWLAAPAVAACEPLGAPTPHCPMLATQGAMTAMADMDHTATGDDPPCHGGDSLTAGECCDVRAAQEPLGALPRDNAESPPGASAAAADLMVIAPRRPHGPAVEAEPPRPSARYKLLSSYLL